jgi:hypothetical protein
MSKAVTPRSEPSARFRHPVGCRKRAYPTAAAYLPAAVGEALLATGRAPFTDGLQLVVAISAALLAAVGLLALAHTAPHRAVRRCPSAEEALAESEG